MNHTASKPNLATASHSAAGTEPRSIDAPLFKLSSESHTQVFISYSVGYRGQPDITISSLAIASRMGTEAATMDREVTEY
jgi:hypothetical protein